MNIVVLEGSPNKNGSSNMLASAFMQGTREAGKPSMTRGSRYMQRAFEFGKKLRQ